jgi:hypothetical protein
MTAQRLAHDLRGRPSGRGFMARCPAHDDRKPSLSINEDDGRLLVRCHAGCEQADVIAALRDRGLWREQAVRTVVAEFVYTDEQGAPLYRVCRTEPKGFFQQRYVGGQWVNGMANTWRVLY